MASLATDLWIVKPRPNSLCRLRLLCFPIGGGNASVFQSWPEGLPPEVEVCAVQLPGRQQRAAEPPFTRMPLLVQALERAVHPYLDLPFAIFGNCTGTLVGYELAQRLRRVSGAQPVHFFASCCRAPHLPDRDSPIHGLPEQDLWDELERLGGTPPIVLQHPELKAMLSPILRADFELSETYRYRPSPPFDCPVTAFGGLQDAIVAEEEIEAWSEHAGSVFRKVMLPGRHYLIESARESLLAQISDALQPALSGEPVPVAGRAAPAREESHAG